MTMKLKTHDLTKIQAQIAASLIVPPPGHRVVIFQKRGTEVYSVGLMRKV